MSNKNGSMWKWALFLSCVVVGTVAFSHAMRAVRDRNEEDRVDVPIVNCDCPTPAPCATGDGIVADGYNVNIVLDGQKWTPPALLSDEEKGYVTVCRKEDPLLVHHPDLNFTKTYKMWHECLDELATARAGYYDEANQCCVQENAFELPLPEPIRVPHQMTEAEHQEELRLMVGPDGEENP